jgi:hypothetical protein
MLCSTITDTVICEGTKMDHNQTLAQYHRQLAQESRARAEAAAQRPETLGFGHRSAKMRSSDLIAAAGDVLMINQGGPRTPAVDLIMVGCALQKAGEALLRDMEFRKQILRRSAEIKSRHSRYR